jgi:hypothetical protein
MIDRFTPIDLASSILAPLTDPVDSRFHPLIMLGYEGVEMIDLYVR